jgi:nucleotide-binding universal stress UspA family protein
MFALPRILLPVDFSGRSIGAAQHAKALACRFHSELHLVHVVDLRVYGLYGVGNNEVAALEFVPGCQQAAQHEMDGFLAGELRNLNVKRALLYGDPAHEILKYAGSEKADLIVLPTRGYGLFRRFLLGSVTTKVLHDAECPVWTGVHMEEMSNTGSVSFGRILCALDPSEGDHSALSWAWQFGRETGGQVKIVHALPALYAPAAIDFSVEVKKHMTAQAESEIRKAQQSAGSTAEVEIVQGDAAKAVCDAAKDWNADLLVISRGVASEFLGRLRSRSYSIIRQSPCPVVSIC